MNLGIILSFKESMHALKNVGQDTRFIEYYLKPYSENFENVYIFSWAKEEFTLPFSNVKVIPNRYNINIYLYNFLLPFIERNALKKCEKIRLTQFTSIIPAVIVKIIYHPKIISTYGFLYGNFLRVKKRFIKLFLWNIVEKILVRSVDKFIVTYEENREYLMSLGVEENKIITITNGVDTEQFRPVEKRNSLGEEIKILFIGRFEVEKNLINTIRAVGRSKYKEKIFFTLIGKGSLEKDIRQELEKYKIRHKIIPSLPHKDLINHFQQSDVFVLASLAEGYPKILVEAMSCGLPCLVSKYKGYESIARDGDNAVLCETSEDSIKEKIDYIIDNEPIRKKISIGARNFVKNNNDIKKLLAIEIEMIKKL